MFKKLCAVVAVACISGTCLGQGVTNSVIVGWGRSAEVQTTTPAAIGLVVQIAAGDYHSVALRHDGSVLCWGSNADGQCNTPANLGPVKRIAAGYNTTIALLRTGSVACWGVNGNGECNVPAGLSDAIQVAGGGYHNLALRANGTIVSWGWNGVGQCTTPAGIGPVKGIGAGHAQTIAIREDGSVWCWGRNDSGECNVPPGLSNIGSVSGGGFHSLARATDGRTWYWGSNGWGQDIIPSQVQYARQVGGGHYHCLALALDRTVQAWGGDWEGQAQEPAGLAGVVQIAAGGYHNLALLAADEDGDGIDNTVDNCPLNANPLQTDSDNDGVGDVCENIANVLPPQEWKVSLGGNGHWYGVYTTSYNWWSATAYARGIGAHLASFNSLAEGEACENLTVNYHQSGPGDYWLGGIQEDTGAEPGGGWRWVYNEAFVPDWRSGEPNNQGDEDCLILNLTSTVGNEIDGACSSSARAIFEWDADCNRDGIVDYGQIMSGAIADTNGNFIPDSCEGVPFGAVEWPTSAGGNGHWYGYSPSGGFNADVTWAAAHHAHLVTWQTLAERTFIEFSLLGMGLGTYRTGAHQDPEGLEPAGGWGWHNGEPWNASVAGWQVGQPVNITGAEDCMIIKRSSSSALPDPYNQSRDCDEVNSSLIEWDADCNHDGLVDFGQIVRGELSDVDGDYLPDVCDCADIIIDGEINGVDLAALLGAWGSSGGANNADVSGDGIVNGADLSLVLAGWGACVSFPAPPSWATVLEWPPNPAVVTDAAFRTRMLATGLPWRVLDNASGIEMLLVPPGTFMMGASPGDSEAASDESPAHQVTLTNAFYLGRTEVTQETWLAEMGSNPSGFTGDLLRPVEFVSWAAIQPFCSQNGLRLPTEAEWEYACRGGNLTSRYGPVGNIAWYTTNSSNQTHTVGTKLPNALGIYDMIGNVWEWSQDWYGPYSATSVTNPTGPASGAYRTPRGGTYMASTAYCRASVRGGVPGTAGQHIGFRVARNP